MTTTPTAPDASALDGASSGFTTVPVRVAKPGLRQDMRAAGVVWRRELIRFSQDRTRMMAALMQPILFLFVLGTGLSSLTRGGLGGINLKTFLYPGILATSTLFTAMFSAISIVWDREFGFLREMLVAPVRRSSIMIGKALGGATVATCQGVLVLILAHFAHVHLSVLLVLALLGEIFILSFTLTALGLVMAARVQQMQAVFGIMQMLLLPLSFLSGALYPIGNLPKWLSVIVHINPITYAVHAVRETIFGHLHTSKVALAHLNPPITWSGWRVPIGVELAFVAVVGVALMAVAIFEFNRAE